MKQFENYAIYIDLVWQNKNNKLAFIMLNKDLRELDSYQESISIFDLKTKTNVLKVYNEIDWKAIELSQRKFQISILRNLKLSEN